MSEESEEKGSVGAIVAMEADPGKSLVTMNIRGLDHGQDGLRDEHVFGIICTLFKHLFKPGFSNHQVAVDDLCVMAQVPTEYLRDEWQAVVENHPNKGGDFRLSRGDDVPWLSIPKVVEKPDEES